MTTHYRATAHSTLPDVFHVIGLDERGHPVAHLDERKLPACYATESQAQTVADELNSTPAVRLELSLSCDLLKAEHELRWARNCLSSAKFRQSINGNNEWEIDYYAECESVALANVERLRTGLATLRGA